MQQLARGKRVLDLCCYTGGFALNAAIGGASSVTGKQLLIWGEVVCSHEITALLMGPRCLRSGAGALAGSD